ncbi:hypothetical protein K6119_01700 [Paracrocinitomix mangrovi]|uniref:hypothetical protein n=1 Tax=Paracrocinitomix mangrovi TaxID=2862509 RepID=UPI001C8EC2BD|nr:hypothetical protein [Paracrocinitomix mangrovi]UKN02231.1 hypothetical protein K6119_01700 [Paracrocinitomix mangrovi]
MSKKSNENLAKLESLVEKHINSEVKNTNLFFQLVEMLNSRRDLQDILNQRLMYHRTAVGSAVPDTIILESFKKFERGQTKEIYDARKSSSSTIDIMLCERCVQYFGFVNSTDGGLLEITDTFQWTGTDPKRRLVEIDYLFSLIIQPYTSGKTFISSSTTNQEFRNLLNGGRLKKKILWNESLKLLVYFIDVFAPEYLVLPEHIEKVISANEGNKEMSKHLNESMVECFKTSDKDVLTPKMINDARYQNRKQSPYGFEIIDKIHQELISSLTR